MEAKNRFLHPIRRSWRYRQPDHARSALTRHDADVGGRSLAVRKTEAFKNARLLKPVDQLIREQRKAMKRKKKRNKKPVDESESGLWHRDEQVSACSSLLIVGKLFYWFLVKSGLTFAFFT